MPGKLVLQSFMARLSLHADVGMNFIDSWINKLMTRVGSLNVIRGKLVIAKTTTESLAARLGLGWNSNLVAA